MTGTDGNVGVREGPAPRPAGADSALFNGLSGEVATSLLLRCLDAAAWAASVLDGRPYRDDGELDDAAVAAASAMDDDALDSALAAHPRIGERPTGGTAALSRAEQSGVDAADVDVTERLRRGNAAYEERFGHVFLIRAAGRSAEEILAQLSERLEHDPGHERAVVRQQLGEIAVLRLHQQLGALREPR